VTGDTLALLQYTSGSTAEPKGVMISHGNLLHNSDYINRAFALIPDSVTVTWLPAYHDMGLTNGIIQPVYKGRPCYLMSPVSFLMRPIRWLQAISRYKATISGGPNFAYELSTRGITPEHLKALDLSSWDVAYNGAEPVRAETMKKFATTFASCGFRPSAFHPCYGLAEATLLVSVALWEIRHSARYRSRRSNRIVSWRPRPKTRMCGPSSAAAARCMTPRSSSPIRRL
jgi:acyl-CoA synthetase (AMP-forming)/AMP-acid ligase II